MVKKPRPLPTPNPTGLLTYIPLLRSMDAVYRERSTGSRPSVPCSAENASLNFQSDPHAAQLHSRALFGKSLPAQLCSVSEKQPNYCQPTKKNIILFPGHHAVVVGVLQSIFYLSREKNPIQFGRRGAFLRPLRRLSVKRTAYDHANETEECGFVLFRRNKEFI